MIQQTIATVQNNINQHIQQNMQIRNNQYGARVGLDHKDQWLTLKVPKKLTDPLPGVMLEYVNGQNGKAEWREINQQNFARFFDTNTYSYSDLLNDLKNGVSLIVSEYVKESQSKTEASMAIESANDSDVQYRTKTFNLFSTGQFSNQYTQSDKEFIYNRIFRDDSNNFYFQLEGQLWPLDFKNNTERTVQGNGMNNETNFWPAFFRTFSAQIEAWNNIIVTSLVTYDPANIGKSVEAYLMDQGVPRTYMECLLIARTERGEVTVNEKGSHSISWYPEKIDIQLDTGTSNHSWTYSNQVTVFSKTLFQSIDADRVKLIPTFTNGDEVAVKHLPAVLPNKCDTVPKLPKTWNMFLGGDRFFDPVMDKMKIACFVHNTYKANYSGRQVLVIGGEGDDGKGTFIKVLEDIVGPKYAVTCKPKNFDGQDRFGLTKIFNKKLVILPDCKQVSALFGYDDFKSLTGGDSMDLDRKYASSIKYSPKGMTVAVCTNNPFYILGEHGKSRVLPVIFRKNFKWNTFIEKDEMVARLLSEKREFLQWCEDYRMFINSKCKGTLLKGDRLRICADADLEAFSKENWDCDDAPNIEYTYFKNACKNQTLKGSIFCSWNQRLEEDAAKVEDIEEVLTMTVSGFFSDKEKLLVDPYLKEYIIQDKETGRCYITTNGLIAYFNLVHMTRGTRFYSYISGLIDMRIGIKNHSKNEFFVGMKAWFEDGGAIFYEQKQIGDKHYRKCFDLTDFHVESGVVDEAEETIKKFQANQAGKDPEKKAGINKEDEVMNGTSWNPPELTAEEKAERAQFQDLLV